MRIFVWCHTYYSCVAFWKCACVVWVRGWKWHLSPCLYQLTSDVSLNSSGDLIGRRRRAVGQWEAAWYSSLAVEQCRQAGKQQRASIPTRQTGRNQPEQSPLLLCLSHLPIQRELSVQLFIETGVWRRALVGQLLCIDFHSAPFLPSYVCLTCVGALDDSETVAWSRWKVCEWFVVSSSMLPFMIKYCGDCEASEVDDGDITFCDKRTVLSSLSWVFSETESCFAFFQ